ncbi:DUF2982 domain-containing protein [Shewanella aestuarii]|uniref:DUF2982 domain-containing protein n=1 Tax=Shewanella aestuarii TaxID=1028752 RepID=A0A6G9QM11_9GAMM|nr:DUF2982 domain-containing protein [Shewanella aestuarii]QIR14889.1 DUF2982 domain-containing protein [Shewanella aestuarii]
MSQLPNDAPTESMSLSISPQTKRNGTTLTIAGATGLMISLLLFLQYKSLLAPTLVLFGLSIVGLLLGISKLNEPPISIKLTPIGLSYFHRRGKVDIEWSNIVRLDSVRLTQNMQLIELPYIGFKLKKINPILDCISPRLATGLLTEQRPLFMTAATHDEDLQSLESYIGAEFTPFISHGDRYRGVLAMFGHRCQTLDDNLGYHLYISYDALDREPKEMVSLLRQWQQQALSDTAQQVVSNDRQSV